MATHDSYTGDLALDAERSLLYVVDQANFRIAVIDTAHAPGHRLRQGRPPPLCPGLSPDRRKLYVTNLGMFEYQVIPGADSKQARATGLPFPAFGFPSAEAAAGVEREHRARHGQSARARATPTSANRTRSAWSMSPTPTAAKVEAFIRTGLPFGDDVHGGSSPSGILAAGDRVFVSNANDDSITVIDAETNTVDAEIPIRIPGLERYAACCPSAWPGTRSPAGCWWPRPASTPSP